LIKPLQHEILRGQTAFDLLEPLHMSAAIVAEPRSPKTTTPQSRSYSWTTASEKVGQHACQTNSTSSQRLTVALRRSLGRHDPPEYGRLQRTHLAGQGSQSPASHVPRAVRIRTGVVTPGARHYQRTSCTDFPYGAIWRSCAPGTPRTATIRASNPAGLRGRRFGQADL
jgi:hypothetical protein